MYDFVDRRVDALDDGGRFLVWAMRTWAGAMIGRQCPPAAIGPGFGKIDLLGALPPFHIAMMILNRDCLYGFHVAAPGCALVGEDEAILLALIHSQQLAPGTRLDATLSLMVANEMINAMIVSLTDVAAALTSAGMSCASAKPAAALRSRAGE